MSIETLFFLRIEDESIASIEQVEFDWLWDPVWREYLLHLPSKRTPFTHSLPTYLTSTHHPTYHTVRNPSQQSYYILSRELLLLPPLPLPPTTPTPTPTSQKKTSKVAHVHSARVSGSTEVTRIRVLQTRRGSLKGVERGLGMLCYIILNYILVGR